MIDLLYHVMGFVVSDRSLLDVFKCAGFSKAVQQGCDEVMISGGESR
jgi:hypothetical protein